MFRILKHNEMDYYIIQKKIWLFWVSQQFDVPIDETYFENYSEIEDYFKGEHHFQQFSMFTPWVTFNLDNYKEVTRFKTFKEFKLNHPEEFI